jgi:hypothetical protein
MNGKFPRTVSSHERQVPMHGKFPFM